MRKVTIIMFIIMILTLGGTCFAAANIYESRDEVTLTEMTAWGNKDFIQDLTMQMNIMYKDRLRWKTMVPMGKPEEAVTEYTSSITPVYADLDRDSGLSMELFMYTDVVQDNILQGTLEGVTKAYAELAYTIGPNEEAENEIYLKDYMDFYEYTIRLKIPGTDIYRNAGWSNKAVKQEQETQKQAVANSRCLSAIPREGILQLVHHGEQFISSFALTQGEAESFLRRGQKGSVPSGQGRNGGKIKYHAVIDRGVKQVCRVKGAGAAEQNVAGGGGDHAFAHDIADIAPQIDDQLIIGMHVQCVGEGLAGVGRFAVGEDKMLPQTVIPPALAVLPCRADGVVTPLGVSAPREMPFDVCRDRRSPRLPP